MIEIVTSEGVRLDLEKSCSFSIEIENPMLDDGGIPCAFSTEITFLPTATNLKVFGWLDGMFTEPDNKRIAADILASGLKLFSGILIYDSIENGRLKYTFSGVDPEESLSEKIYNADLFSQKVNQSMYFQLMQEAASGNQEGFAVPPLIGKNQVTEIELPGDIQTIEPNVKFRNVFSQYNNPIGNSEMAVFAPAVRVTHILSGVLDKFGLSCPEDWNDIAILGLYAGSESLWGLKYEPYSPSFSGQPEMDVAHKLPDISFLELLQNILKITCSTMFTDAGQYIIKSKSSVMNSSPSDDWSGKISDQFVLCSEDAKYYKFGYSDDDNGTSDSSAIDGRNTITKKNTLKEMPSAFTSSEYTAIMCGETGDIFSGKRYEGPLSSDQSQDTVLMDSVYHNAVAVAHGNQEDQEFDSSSDFKLVKCLPLTIFTTYSGSSRRYICRANVPVVQFPELGADRSPDAYIGLLYKNQLVDKGITLGGVFGNTVSADEYNFGRSLTPAYLYETAHKDFAEWISSKRLCLKTDLNLSVFDIANFRMYNKVRIKGHNFIVKKLSLTLYAGSDSIEAEGELLSC